MKFDQEIFLEIYWLRNFGKIKFFVFLNLTHLKFNIQNLNFKKNI